MRLKTTRCWIFIRLSARGDEMTEKVQDVDVDTEKAKARKNMVAINWI